MSGELEGKVGLISGAARGMGAEEARLFASEGAKVVLGDVLDEEGEKTAAEIGESAVYVHLDVTSEADWLAAVEKAEQAFGKLDILVNNAGILRFGLLEHTPLEEFESVVKVNQTGTFLGMKSVVAAMRRAGGFSIVNISSLAGIRVNSIHPGGIETPMTRPFGADSSPGKSHEYGSPIPRIGRPDEVANLVLWVASDKSSYCTGSEFVVDGGESAGQMPDALKQVLRSMRTD
jgi:3alpha(or 20beta)-hydroxysteroid dehydrogenase